MSIADQIAAPITGTRSGARPFASRVMRLSRALRPFLDQPRRFPLMHRERMASQR
jgi:hypothetical protein